MGRSQINVADRGARNQSTVYYINNKLMWTYHVAVEKQRRMAENCRINA